jgi:hypothetical protein
LTYDPNTDNATMDGELLSNADARVPIGDTPYYVKKEANLMIVRAPGFRIALKRVLHTHRQRLPHFDHAVDIIRNEIVHPHGLLGQTALFTKPVKAVDHQGTGIIEGRLEDYEVNNVFSTHCAFNRFGVASSQADAAEGKQSDGVWFNDWFKHEVIPHGTLKRDGNPVKPAQRTSTFFVTANGDLKMRPLPSGRTLRFIEHPAFVYNAKMATVSGYAGKTLAVEEIVINFKNGAQVVYAVQTNNVTVNGHVLDAGETVEITTVEGTKYTAQKMRVKNGGAIIELPGVTVFLRVDMIKGLRFGQQLEQTNADEVAKFGGFLGSVLKSGARTLDQPAVDAFLL